MRREQGRESSETAGRNALNMLQSFQLRIRIKSVSSWLKMATDWWLFAVIVCLAFLAEAVVDDVEDVQVPMINGG